MEIQSIGQETEIWDDFWQGLSPEDEIRMWDFYGGRHWILKYVPRFGKTLEAGCGLGRYVFYLNGLGIDVEGIDFSDEVVAGLLQWQSQQHLTAKFQVSDVTDLPYADSSLSGYISLGVIEHFVEGPHKAIAEAHRVLRPGGVAIITTPSVHLVNFYREVVKKGVRNLLSHRFGMKLRTSPFFQYWYRPARLKGYVQECGLRVVNYGGADLLYICYELAGNTDRFIAPGSFAVSVADKFENTRFAAMGAQAVTISIKVAEIMFCFMCGELTAREDSLLRFDVALCSDCQKHPNAAFYRGNRRPRYQLPYAVNPRVQPVEIKTCSLCDTEYETSFLFEDFGFDIPVCPVCLKNPHTNIWLSNEHVKAIWRLRG